MEGMEMLAETEMMIRNQVSADHEELPDHLSLDHPRPTMFFTAFLTDL